MNEQESIDNDLKGVNISKIELLEEKRYINKSSNNNKAKILNFYKILVLILFVIIIFLIIYITILSKKINELNSMNELYKIFNSTSDVKIFLKNKTEYYYMAKKIVFKRYDESNLRTFQSKVHYLVIHESPEYKSNIADKIKVCEYSKKILGKDLCIPILKIYDNVDEINLDELPEQFVLKCNHGSGMNIFCKDKSKFDFQQAKKNLSEWMDTNYGLHGAELQYYFIKRKIFASPYLGDLVDYKVYCFNGKPKYIAARIVLNENRNRFIYNYYYTNWTLSDIDYGTNIYKRDPNITIEKPKNLDLIVDYSEKLSQEFVFIRVDFYEINSTLYLGELTFTPSNAEMPFKNLNQKLYLGSLLNISKIKPSLFNN